MLYVALIYVMLNGSYASCKVNNIDRYNWCSILTILYAKYPLKMLCMVRLRNKKFSETGPKRPGSGTE